MPNPLPLAALFQPESIAVVGASRDPRRLGHQVLTSLVGDGYAGTVYPINPTADVIGGLSCVGDLRDIEQPVDVVVVALSAGKAVEVARHAADRGDRFVVVCSAGFAEAGPDGETAQQQLTDAIAGSGTRVLGPNCMGLFDTATRVNLTGHRQIPSGRIGIISQSGNVALSLIADAWAYDVGFSTFVGLGNQSDLTATDFLTHYAADDDTAVVAVYLEGLPAGGGPAFLDALAATAARKPVVVLKGGVTAAGRRASQSHTAGLAGRAAAFSAAVRQAGGIEVGRLDELLPAAEVLLRCPTLAGDDIAVIGSGGGHSILSADAVESAGLRVPPFGAELREKITARLPAWAPTGNPVDMTGAFETDLRLFADIASDALIDTESAGVLFFGLYGYWNGPDWTDEKGATFADAAGMFAEVQREFGRPAVVYSPYARMSLGATGAIRASGVPCYDSFQLVSTAFRVLRARPDTIRAAREFGARGAVEPAGCGGHPSPATARRRAARNLTEPESYRVLAAHGIPVCDHRDCPDEPSLGAASAELAPPFVLKAIFDDVVHKSDQGAVVTGLPDAAAVLAAAADLRARLGAPTSFLLASQLSTKTELLVGMTRDPTFGPIVVVGAGGALTELHDDAALLVDPFTDADVDRALDSLRLAPHLAGARGVPPVDRAHLAALLHRVADLARRHPEIDELDINPVLLGPAGLAAADARIIVGSDGT